MDNMVYCYIEEENTTSHIPLSIVNVDPNTNNITATLKHKFQGAEVCDVLCTVSQKGNPK